MRLNPRSASPKLSNRCPCKNTCPCDGCSNPPNACNNVLLPEPLDPTIETNSPADILIQKIESNNNDLTFVRVDSDHIDNLIKKEETTISKLSDTEKESLKTSLEAYIPKAYTVQLEAMDSQAAPFIITQPEFMRRMKEMSQTGGGGMFGMGNMPEMYNLVVNINSDLASNILNTEDKSAQESLVKQALDLAKLSQNLLKGEELTAFVKRSFDLIK